MVVRACAAENGVKPLIFVRNFLHDLAHFQLAEAFVQLQLLDAHLGRHGAVQLVDGLLGPYSGALPAAPAGKQEYSCPCVQPSSAQTVLIARRVQQFFRILNGLNADTAMPHRGPR